MKNCKSIEKQLTAYLHGELSASAFQTLEKHLEGCDACRAELEARRSTLRLLGEALEAAPAPERLTRRVNGTQSAPHFSWGDLWYSPRTRAVLVTAAACSLVAVLSVSVVKWSVVEQSEVTLDFAPQEEHLVALEDREDPTFSAAPLPRPKLKLKKPDAPVAEPKSTTRIVTKTSRPSMPEIVLPEVEGVRGEMAEVTVVGSASPMMVADADGSMSRGYSLQLSGRSAVAPESRAFNPPSQVFSAEQYDLIVENAFKAAMENPLSTFSIDVDRAAYANVRRFLTNDQLPPLDAIRIEEMVNYFKYDYPQPKDDAPFLVSTEVGECPWNPDHQLALIGLQGLEIEKSDLPPNNLVFLLDVSGSMNNPNKLPLLKSAMRLLVDQLRPEDRVSIVVYAGAAGVVLEPTADKAEILDAIKRLNAGGSTAGGAGIELAYKIAKQAFMKNGNNRVVLATDGDFNVGASSDGDLVRLIEEKRNSGIYLTVLGFGTGNYKDSKMEKLADKGNGNYAYIDDILEAKKVLVNEMGGTLVTIAKDVKVQIEFNPKHVKGYRLIGYENRMLAAEDFNDDLKDAGELGAGHTVTALYELIPAGSDLQVPTAGDLKYQKTRVVDSDELMTVKLRYKHPDEDESQMIKRAVAVSDISAITNQGNLAFASAVAEFGMLLRDSQYKGSASFEDVLKRARAAKGKDDEGYRAEFIRLVEKAELLSNE